MRKFFVSFAVITSISGFAFGQEMTDISVRDLIGIKTDEIMKRNVFDYALLWGESNPSLQDLLAGKPIRKDAPGNLLQAVQAAKANPIISGKNYTDLSATVRAAKTIDKTCVSNILLADAAGYRSQPLLCTIKTVDRDFVQREIYANGYTVDGSYGNIDFGHSQDGISFFAIYSPDGKLRHFNNLVSLMQ